MMWKWQSDVYYLESTISEVEHKMYSGYSQEAHSLAEKIVEYAQSLLQNIADMKPKEKEKGDRREFGEFFGKGYAQTAEVVISKDELYQVVADEASRIIGEVIP